MHSSVLAAPFVAIVLGCATGTPTAPEIEQRIVVQAVLDPQNGEQIILVARTQSGTVVPPSTVGNVFDPIVRTGGVPISGARVVIFGPGTDSIVAVEDRALRSDGAGAGVYRVPSRAVQNSATSLPAGILRIAPGARYQLRVDTPLGTVTGTTRVPLFNLTLNRAVQSFNLDTDSLRRPAVADDDTAPAGYLLFHQWSGAVHRAWAVADDNAILIWPASNDDDRTWSFAYSRRYIHPGAVQRFLVVALDSNYYEYNVGAYDPFGHDAVGNRLEGGVGLFGAVATVVDAQLDLVANCDHAIEGEWTPMVATTDLPAQLRLYESPRFPGPSGSAGLHLWGTARMPNSGVFTVDASAAGDTVQLQLALTTSSPIKRISGTFDGKILTLSAPGSAVRVRYQNAENEMTTR
jgi:hypothetical protein